MKNLQLITVVTALMLAGLSASAQIVFLVQEPANLAGSYNFTYSSQNGWGADMDTVNLTAEAAFAIDGSATEDSLVCGNVVNQDDIDGKIAVLYRGACQFSEKAKNVQDSGAVALVIINNVPGAPVGMGGGNFNEVIDIPVVMISDADGALLRDSIMAGGVEIFLGNNTGLYAKNVGSYTRNVSSSNSYATPIEFAHSSADFNVQIGAWVYNYGNQEAVNALVSATIVRDGSTTVYDESSDGVNIAVGDSAFYALPTYEEDTYLPGLYTLTYSIVTDDTDEFPDDNEVVTSFWINEEGIYSKSTVDPENGPVAGNGIRPADSDEFQWCIALESATASELSILGMTFSTLTTAEETLEGKYVILSVYEWNDPIQNGQVGFTDLNEVTGTEIYDYVEDLQDEFVSYTFEEPIELIDDQKYLACATIEDGDMFLATDAGLDYTTMYETYADEVFFPVNGDAAGDWFPGGFGGDNVPALILNLGVANSIADDLETADVTPYPNPTVDNIVVPLGTVITSEIVVNVFDVKGTLVMSETVCQKSDKLRLDVSGLSSGLHTFNLIFEDNSTTSFKVVVTK